MVQLLRFESKKDGVQFLCPLYDSLELIIEASCYKPNKKNKEVRITVDKSSIVKPEIKNGEDDLGIEFIPSDESNHYYLTSNAHGRIKARILFKCITGYEISDIFLDKHVGKTVMNKADQISTGISSKYELANRIYQYVYNIPCTREDLIIKTPTKIIKSNKANLCSCKAELFTDLCRVHGIPTRKQYVIHFHDNQLKMILKGKRIAIKDNVHEFSVFYDNGWHLVDPTLKGFDQDFSARNYFNFILSAKGFDYIHVKGRKFT